jgi:hypothetical protein
VIRVYDEAGNVIETHEHKTISERCASTIQIVRPSESMAETQPQLQPASLRLSAITSQFFIPFRAIALMIMPVGFNCGFEFEKGRQLLIGVHDKTSGIATLCSHNPKLSALLRQDETGAEEEDCDVHRYAIMRATCPTNPKASW